MKNTGKYIHIVFALLFFNISAAETLFEVKDASNNTVLEVSTDGLRIFNEGDTLMVISSSEIKAFIEQDGNRALSRAFSVTTSSSTTKGQNKVFKIGTDEGATFYNPLDNTDEIFSISRSGITANVNPGTGRDFVIDDQVSAKSGGNLMKVSNKPTFETVNDSTMLWYKQKNAFRVGHVLITDPNNVGQASFGAGGNARASGDFSVAMGSVPIASGYSSVALGENAWATGDYSTAFGSNTEANYYCDFAAGSFSKATGGYSIAMGDQAHATKQYSFAVGYAPFAEGYSSTSIGYRVLTQSDYCFSIGRYNTVSGGSGWIDTDPLFVVGNGTNEDEGRSNAFEVKKNGDTYIYGKAFVDSSFTLGGSAGIAGDVNVDGQASIGGDTHVSGNMGVGASPNSLYGLYSYHNSQAIRGYASTSTGTGTIGIYAWAYGGSSTNYGIYARGYGGTTNFAGYFNGNVRVTGTFDNSKSETKIDHPLDPENKYLSHSGVISDQMTSVYNGNIVLDGSGSAKVQLPEWFEAMNTDFKYQLTAIGAPGPNLYIARKVSGNSFEIAGGSSGMEVSWQITSVRNDNFAKSNPLEIESKKKTDEIGYYLHPESFGLSEEKGIDYQIQKREEDERK